MSDSREEQMRFSKAVLGLAGAVILSACSGAATSGPNGSGSPPATVAGTTGIRRVVDFSPFTDAMAAMPTTRVEEIDTLLAGATIPDIAALISTGELTSSDLVTYYALRIQKYDVNALNSVMELDPTALDQAKALDARVASGESVGPLGGVPVMVKDNITAGPSTHTTAGAFALRDFQPTTDAFLVARLRAAGAVIMGKNNLSEWANWMDDDAPDGYSAMGGQTRNPYGFETTFGSSSGSAVATSAGLTAGSVGTETQGSIIMPATINSVVGLKTSRGLVSRTGVIPMLESQDAPGPLGRTVTDVAVLLTALTGVDPTDPRSEDAAALAGTDFTQYLQATPGIRVGVFEMSDAELAAHLKGLDPEAASPVREILEANRKADRQRDAILRKAGFKVVVMPRALEPMAPDVTPLFIGSFATELGNFLSGQPGTPVQTLAQVVAVNKQDITQRAPFGQAHLIESLKGQTSPAKAAKAAQTNQAIARAQIDKALKQGRVDVLITSEQAYAAAGYPAITVPGGYDEDRGPTGPVFIGGFLSEPQLITAAYTYEQATKARKDPDLAAR